MTRYPEFPGVIDYPDTVEVSADKINRMERKLTSVLDDPDAKIDSLSRGDIRSVILQLRELRGD